MAEFLPQNKEQSDKSCKGELCPFCMGTNIKETGYCPDLFNMNQGYRCLECTNDWEGY